MEDLEQAMFGAEAEAEAVVEPQADAVPVENEGAAADEAVVPEAAPAETPEAVAPEATEPMQETAAPEETADDLSEPEGLSEKASARFQALANQVREYRAKDAEYRQMEEAVQEFRTMAQESCNNGDEVAQLFDFARAVKTGDFDTVERYLQQQVMQFEALSGRRLQVDLLGQYPDIVQRMDEMGLDELSAQELARSRWQQQRQQAFLQQQQQQQLLAAQQQQQEAEAAQQRQAVFDRAIEDVNRLSAAFAKSDVLWAENEPKVLAFARQSLPNLPPEQWVFALQAFHDGLRQSAAVRPSVAPLRSGAAAGAVGEPQSMEEAMFNGM